MGQLYIPYKGEKPATVTINGHRLVLISSDKSEFENKLELLGADQLEVIESGESQEEQDVSLYKLAEKVEGGVVVAPSEVKLEDILKNLEQQLPWVQ